jgi:hypothetical protein
MKKNPNLKQYNMDPDLITGQTNVSSVTLESIDDFLPMPGADSVVTSDQEKGAKPTVFSKPDRTNLDFLDDDDEVPEGQTKPNAVDTTEAIAALDDILEDDAELGTKPGRRKTDKNGLVEFLKKRIETNEMFTFDDFDDTKQNLDEYLGGLSEKDIEELWTANVDTIKKDVAASTPKEFMESLPKELRQAAEYVQSGGKDIKGMLRALSQVEEMRSLDPSNEDHQEAIVRNYLHASGFGNGDQDMIEEQIEEWAEAGTLNKKAGQFKPKLDSMQEEIMQGKMAQQEAHNQSQIKKKEEYMNNIYETLKPSELNGVKIDSKRQKFLWDELTTVKYESMQGRPTNLLGKLLEDHQFSDKPRYDLIAETLWLLSDPDDYKENIRRQVKNETTQETVRSLKTEQNRRLASTVDDTAEETKPVSRKLTKTQNIFKR